jgi:hypothetical protein
MCQALISGHVDRGPDVALIHDGQLVVLKRAEWLAWLDLTRPEGELLRLLPAGSLAVQQVRQSPLGGARQPGREEDWTSRRGRVARSRGGSEANAESAALVD